MYYMRKTAGALFFFIFLSGCGKIQEKPVSPPEIVLQSDTSLSPSYGDAVIEASIADAVVLNPVLSPDTTSGRIISLIFNGLLRENENLVLVPDLAETVEVQDNGKTLRFILKKNIYWHDGEKFSSADVKFTWEKIMDPHTQTYDRDYFSFVDTVETPDDLTVIVRYSEPFVPALISWTTGIIPQHLLKNEDINTSRFNQCPVGTGPFRFVEWNRHEQIVLQANREYFEGRPYIDRFIFKVIPDASMSFVSLLRGEIDLITLTPDQYVKKASETDFTSKFNTWVYPSRTYTYVGFNLNHHFFKDLNVRKALCLATDRQTVISDVLHGYGKIISGPFPPSFWACDSSISPWPYDPDQASRILSQSGFSDTDNDGILEKDGQKFSVRICTNGGNEIRKITSMMIREFWKKIGVEVSVELVEWSVLMDLCDYRNFDSIILSWSLDGDPDPYGMWHSSQIPDKASGIVGDNFISYTDPVTDRLLDEGRKEFNPEKRKEIYHRFHQILHENIPYIFLFSAESIRATDKRIHGISCKPAGILYNFEKWYIPDSLKKY